MQSIIHCFQGNSKTILWDNFSFTYIKHMELRTVIVAYKFKEKILTFQLLHDLNYFPNKGIFI